jgi:hypothetical protein
VPFDITGAIQSLTAFNPANPYSGGTIVVNGITILIPANLVVTLPAAYKTVGQLFMESPNPGFSALALTDIPAPLAAFEANLSGNIVNGTFIAGLVSISQQSLNTANGFIRSINYATGVLCVGGTPGPCAASDARVVINDTEGRYGLANGSASKVISDSRFGVDSDNPTIHAASGYPMCVPRVAPPAIDTECPMANRPVVGGAFLTTFVMDTNFLIPPAPFTGGAVTPCGAGCNVNKQAPLVVGDYISFSGINAVANGLPYIAAYAIEANVGIFTPIGGPVFYYYMDAPLITTGPAICPANAECQARLRTSIFGTDPSRTPAMYAVDENLLGARTSRPLLSTLVNTAQLGRWVFHTEKDIRVLGGASGVTREIMARVAGGAAGATVYYSTTPGVPAGLVKANGLVFGQYVSPVGEYIFPEPNLGGAVLTPYNFRCLQFLANGWGQGGALPGLTQITPFPEAVAPATVNCTF